MKKHLRKTICLLAIVIMVMASTTMAFASSVTYEGQAEKFVFTPGTKYSLTDLFTNYKGVMPGDQLTQQITVKNDVSDKVDVEIFIKSLGASDLQSPEDGIAEVSAEKSQDFLEELTLTVVQNDDSELFHAPADQTAQITDWVSLGKLDSGAEVDITVTLNVPITMGNECQNLIGALDWQFKVVETPVPQESKTGDDMNLLIPLCLMAAAGFGAIVLFARRKKKEQ